MDENEYDDDMFTIGPAPMRRFVPVDLLVLTLHLASEIASALHSTTVAAFNIAAQHANYRVGQRDFREQVTREIETMTTTGEDDG